MNIKEKNQSLFNKNVFNKTETNNFNLMMYWIGLSIRKFKINQQNKHHSKHIPIFSKGIPHQILKISKILDFESRIVTKEIYNTLYSYNTT